MAYVVPRGSRGWELRQSQQTENGPRSRTLASFRSLTPEVIAKAIERSGGRLDESEIVRAARKAGAPVEADPASEAGASLLSELAAGRPPRGGIRRALLAALADAPDSGEGRELSEAERSASEWLGASAAERGSALHDLLLLADRLPSPTAPRMSRTSRTRPEFPRLHSAGA